MASVGILEAKTQLSGLVDRVANGEEITITRHGKPVARIVPANGVPVGDVQALVRRMRDGRTATLGGLDWKTLRDAGRP
ncbi:MAG: type II toxin-antitoxin system prevent-host-death family antitoxin [Devosia sp.]